jgi:large subunit ribosomal protein L14
LVVKEKQRKRKKRWDASRSSIFSLRTFLTKGKRKRKRKDNKKYVDMALVGTRFYVSDNSGAKEVQCIRIVDKGARIHLGTMLLVSVKAMKHKGKVAKGDLQFAIVVELKTGQRRRDGSHIASSRNAVVLVSQNKQPLGTRILGLVPYEVRRYDGAKLLSLAARTI